MKERIVIVLIAIALGIFVTTLVFFIYQQTKILPKNASQTNSASKEKPQEKYFLSIEEPKDESLTEKRTIEVKGKTNPGNTILISTNQEDVVATPTSDGKFSATITIDAGTNNLTTRSVTPDGEEKVDTRIVTFSTEDF